MGSDECDSKRWRMPLSFELCWVLVVLIGYAVILSYTFYVWKEKKRRLLESQLTLSHNYHRIYLCAKPLKIRTSRAEWIDLVLILIYELFFGINLIRMLLHTIPQFEDGMVSGSQGHRWQNRRSDGDSNHKSDLHTLIQYCRFDRTLVFLAPAITLWSMLRLLLSRLFHMFDTIPTLSFSRAFQRWTTAIVDGLSIILFLVWCYATVIVDDSCITVWDPIDDPKHSYFTCSANPSPTHIGCIIAGYLIIIAVDSFALMLLVRTFYRLIEVQNSLARMRDAEGNPCRRGTTEGVYRLLRLMVKLTTLASTALVSSLLLSIMHILVNGLLIGTEMLLFMDYLINNVCLLMVFKYLDNQYSLLCEHRCCLVHWWVQHRLHSKMDNQHFYVELEGS